MSLIINTIKTNSSSDLNNYDFMNLLMHNLEFELLFEDKASHAKMYLA